MDSNNSNLQTQDTMPSCPHCDSPKQIVRTGFRKTKKGRIQRYLCRKCGKYFTPKPLPHSYYPPKIVFSAISNYNLGFTLTEATKITNQRYKTHFSVSTLQFWLIRYKNICTFTSLRKRYTIDPENIIFSKKFYHQQVYEFKYHNLKLNIMGKQYPNLKSYLINLPKERDNKMFKDGLRCSDFPFELSFPKPKITKYETNNATKIAGLGQEMARTNKERHQAIEDFFLINDSATIAIEIPVFLTPKEARTYEISIPKTLTGHIDILQVRNNRMHILDYKPEAQSDKQAVEQLTLYALALGNRTKIPPRKMICGYFDENGYFQFKPIL
jgi:transposase-like protein